MTMNDMINSLRFYGFEAFKLFVAFIGGYIIGYIISKVVEKVLKISELQKTLVRYGAVTTNLWASITSFIAQYVKWYTVIFVINAVFFNQMIDKLFIFLTNLLLFIVLLVIGLLIGGFLHKITKETLVAIGMEAELERHHVADSLGGIPLSSILASIVKWYVVLVFLNEGISKLGLPMLSGVMGDLLTYIPNAILGLLIILTTLIIADFTGSSLRKRNVAFSEFLALVVEIVIVFFGAVLALPKFGIVNVSILEDSFKILMVGVAIGLAIAMGLGLKDAIKRATTYYEEETVEHRKHKK